ILVHGAVPLNWGAEGNQVDWIRRLNALLRSHAAFADGATLEVVSVGEGEQLGISRRSGDAAVLVLVNLDLETPSVAAWGEGLFPTGSCSDLLDGSRFEGGRVELAPGQVRCITAAIEDLDALEALLEVGAFAEPEPVLAQRVAALESDIARWFGREGSGDLLDDPEGFCANASGGGLCPMSRWDWEHDAHRAVVVPAGWGILVRAPERFSVTISGGGKIDCKAESLPLAGGGEFVLMMLEQAGDHQIEVVMYGSAGIERKDGTVYRSPRLDEVSVDYGGDDQHYALCTNDRGGMSYVRGGWGQVKSQYDALLAANLHDDYPVDRQILLVRCRAWVVYRDYSRELGIECQSGFRMAGDNTVEWRFEVPVGGGKQVGLRVRSQLIEGENQLRLRFERERVASHGLSSDVPVRLIVRPDVDDRGFHEKTKAFQGAEAHWPASCEDRDKGFRFSPYDHSLEMACRDGGYFPEPEWLYSVGHPVDASRGLGGESDLFSPGYFETSLVEGETFKLAAAAGEVSALDFSWEDDETPARLSVADASKLAIADFVVKRDDTRTVIAGYPWFLDWGRDTLICLRGMIAAGMLEESLDILKQFAHFERDGTLPNMIRGGDDSNRDTSDAPLWFFVGVSDLVAERGEHEVLGTEVAGRTLAEVMLSIGKNYRDGTPNGIRMDPASGLVFSPSHYTWMDTNHPAGTPRMGYPIEIQALWCSALRWLHRIEPGGGWDEIRGRVQSSIIEFFYDSRGQGFLSDCLHASQGQPAAEAVADDHLRPNQLFALTLGAIDDAEIARGVLAACEELLVPGGVRSLADREVSFALPVRRDGVLLNDPVHPYWGRYEGDEDTRRKPAYHNGTVWNWPFPSYAEALFLTYGEPARDAAESILASAVGAFNGGCLGHLPEVMDGDAPHQERGCGAQAWSVTELHRVIKVLSDKTYG
ncbi:MAG: amylo-alpha-1,6-glucosidase, partial [Verrucomicrobiales bacterium]